MNCSTSSPAARRYLRRFIVSMLVYSVTLTLVVSVFVLKHPAGPLAWGLAVLPALPIVAMMAIFGLYLAEETDEFQRTVAVQAILWATGATLSMTTIWAFLEDFTHAAHLDPMWIFPAFCGVWGIATPLVMRRYK